MAKHTFTIFKLHFTTPLHIGDVRDDYSISLKTISSDTIYAALTSCLAKLGRHIPDNGDLGCTVSSLFPFYQKDKTSESILFFPKPLKQVIPSLKDVKQAKYIKKVEWLDKYYFERTINGIQLYENEKDLKNIRGNFLANTSEEEFDKSFIFNQVSSRVNVSRNVEESATPFYMDRIFFKGYSGLYFFVDGDISLLKPALDLLQLEGIGTDRGVGNGFFEYEESHVELDMPDCATYSLSLSSFIPESKESLDMLLKGDNVSYDFIRRGGWITTEPHNTIRKNVIYAFSSASVFSKQATCAYSMGKIVDLRPEIEFDPKVEHPVWRCGRALFIPIMI